MKLKGGSTQRVSICGQESTINRDQAVNDFKKVRHAVHTSPPPPEQIRYPSFDVKFMTYHLWQ